MTAEGRRRARLAGQPERHVRLPLPDYALEVVRFGAILHGFLPYCAPWYPTRDHIIPATLFYVLYRRLDVALALERLNTGHGMSVAAQLAAGQRPVADQREAFPEEEPDGR